MWPHHFFVPHVFSPIKIFWFVIAILISRLALLTFVWRSLLYNHGICKSLWLWWKPKLETSDWFLTLDCFSFPYLSLSFVLSYPSPIDLLVSVCFLFFLFLLFGCFAWFVIFFFFFLLYIKHCMLKLFYAYCLLTSFLLILNLILFDFFQCTHYFLSFSPLVLFSTL